MNGPIAEIEFAAYLTMRVGFYIGGTYYIDILGVTAGWARSLRKRRGPRIWGEEKLLFLTGACRLWTSTYSR